MQVGDLVRLTTNEQQGLGIVISKAKTTSGIPTHYLYRIQWANGRITTGGDTHVEVINESR